MAKAPPVDPLPAALPRSKRKRRKWHNLMPPDYTCRAGRKQKLSITLDADLASQIREIAGDGHISEWLNDAAVLMLQAQLIDDLIREHKVVIRPDLIAEIEAAWPIHD